MNNYVVALISLLDNEIKQFKISAKDEYEALKIGLIEFAPDEESKKHEIEFQKSKHFPKNIDDLDYHLLNGEITFSIINL